MNKTMPKDNELSREIESLRDAETRWQADILQIARRYDPKERNHEIIFYGASNFSCWKSMEEDLFPFRVQNHAFGGSTDHDLDLWSAYMLNRYEPLFIFFQTGSNDYAESPAKTDAGKIAEAMAYKRGSGFVDDVLQLFLEDQIHLTDAARITWANTCMIPVMEELGMPKAE